MIILWNVLCAKGKIESGKTNFPVEIKEGIVFIKNVPANICSQCGEVFIADNIAKVLEKIASKAKKNKIELELVSYEMVA